MVLNWEYACGKDYNLQVSYDNTNWTTVKSVTGNTAYNTDLSYPLTNTMGRYVRMQGVHRNTAYGYSIYEMKVYGTPIAGRGVPQAGSSSPLTSSFSAYPNPADQAIQLMYDAEEEGSVIAVLSDLTGRMVLKQELPSQKGSNSKTLDISGIANGAYLLQIVQKGQATQVLKVAVQH